MTLRRGAGLVSLVLLVAACTTGGEPPATVSPTSTTVPSATTITEASCPDAFCIVYRIRPEADWSDGRPVTAEDFAFTYQAYASKQDQPLWGYDLVTEVTIIDEKTFRLALSEVFPAWRTLFPVVLPAHAPSDPRVTSGPFVMADAAPDAVVVRRNPAYWAEKDPLSGEPLGDVETLRFVDPGGLRSSLGALLRGEVHLIVPDPLDWALAEIGEMEGVTLRLAPGPVWEHIDFNHIDPLLSQPWVRQAFARAIDREAILAATVRTLDPSAPALGSTVWMTNSVNYEDHYTTSYDPVAAIQILLDRGCVRGGDGIFVCDGARMSFVWAAAAGDPMRRAVFEVVSDQLAQVGIEVVADFRTPSELYAAEFLFGGPEDWQLINFPWQGSADPYRANSIYRCEGELNVNRYCNPEVETLIDTADRTLDPGERVRLYNQADAVYLADLAVIPLFQRPVALAWRSDLAGPQPNISRSTPLWNVASWSGRDEAVIALSAVPTLGDLLFPTNPEEAMVIAALYYGAFGVDPELRFVPVLVESAEAFVGAP